MSESLAFYELNCQNLAALTFLAQRFFILTEKNKIQIDRLSYKTFELEPFFISESKPPFKASLIECSLFILQSFRGRKAINSGAVVSPRAQQPPTSSVSPAPAAVPHPSPNTSSSTAALIVVSGS